MICELRRLPGFATLPIAAHLDEIKPGRSVIQSPPGTGKTTVVPPAIEAQVAGRVVVTQPRRIAARAASRHLARLTGTRPGDYAGHTVRGESTATSSTRVEFVTTGVLLRRLLRDPSLTGVDAVILDEVHERHLDADLAFAMIAELAQLRDDLTVVAMSATLEAARWAELLGADRIVDVPGILFPLDLRFAPPPVPPFSVRGVSEDFLHHVADVAADAAKTADGSTLVFVPGVREVDLVVRALEADGLRALPLHGRLSSRAQDAALTNDGSSKVVVATSVAESSLTVPGVRVVVDAGLAREQRFDTVRAVSGLVTVRESKASAIQRAGRAARLQPGVAIRCFREEDWATLEDESTPEVLTADLTDAVLTLAAWGSPGGREMPLPTALPDVPLARATEELRVHGLVDANGAVTELGGRVAQLPLEPRLGVALLEGARRFGAHQAGEIVAMLADDPSGDLLVELTRRRRDRYRPWLREADRLAKLAEVKGHLASPSSESEAVAAIVALARPYWLARRRGQDTYLAASGTGLTLPYEAHFGAPWLAVWDTQRVGQRVLIRAAVAIDEALALALGKPEEIQTVTFEGKVRGRRTRRLGAITLSETAVSPPPEAAKAAVRNALQSQGLALFPWTDAATGLRRRLAFAHRTLGDPWPEVFDEALLARIDDWFAPELAALAYGATAASICLENALRRLLPWQAAARLDDLVPERIEVPTGSRIRLDYPSGDGAVVCAVKLQECFGLQATPTICDGKARVLMHLLSPAGRPLAVTDDLASFWAGPYQQVRAENRGRYAKHPWPVDPLAASPMRGAPKGGNGI